MPKRKINTSDFIKIKIKKSHRPCVMHVPLIPKLGRQRQVDHRKEHKQVPDSETQSQNTYTHTHTKIH